MADVDHKLHPAAWLTAVVLVALPATGAHAQDAETITIEQLQDALAKRDAVIVDLLNRVRALEQSPRTSEPDTRPDAAADEVPVSRDVVDGQEAAQGQGDFEIDELAAERALERALVQEGARLLEPGQFDVEPRFAAYRSNGMFPTALMSGETSIVGEISRTYDVQERSLNLRVGLPWESQLEIGLPYVTVDRKIETGVDGTVQSVMKDSGSGAGDATVSFAKVLAGESGARPNLIGSLVWLTGSGDERDGEFVLGSGYSGLGGRLSAYWRRDPVVLTVSGGYTRYDDDSGLRPGDSLDVSLGLGLALSPETALHFSLNQTFAEEFKRDGIELSGTDRLASTLDLAISTILGRRLFLRGYSSAGLTDESPDYGFGISLSSRFDVR